MGISVRQGDEFQAYTVDDTPGGYFVRFPYCPEVVKALKTLPVDDRHWRSKEGAWWVRHGSLEAAKSALAVVGWRVSFFSNVTEEVESAEPESPKGKRPRSPFRVLHLRQSAPAVVVRAAYLALKNSSPEETHVELDSAYRVLCEWTKHTSLDCRPEE